MTSYSEEVFAARARVMKALASPVRLRIIEELKCGECCICELQPLFSMNKSTLSRHISALKSVGIVRERRHGVRIYFRLATPCVLQILKCATAVMRSDADLKSSYLANTASSGARGASKVLSPPNRERGLRGSPGRTRK